MTHCNNYGVTPGQARCYMTDLVLSVDLESFARQNGVEIRLGKNN